VLHFNSLNLNIKEKDKIKYTMRLKTQYIKYNKINNDSRNSKQTIKIKSVESQRHNVQLKKLFNN